MTIIGGPSSQLLAGRVAAITGQELALCEYRSFPDGEAYCHIQSDLDDDVMIIQSTPTDRDLIYLMQLLDICQGRRISLVVPYLGYSRQDKIFKPGEPLSARAVATAISPFLQDGAVITVNIHAPAALAHFRCKTENLDATPLLAGSIKKTDICDPVIISPDKGAINMARTLAKHLGVSFDHLEKTRISGTEVFMAPKEMDVKGRDVVIIDDMIATGGTMATAISLLKSQGARRVFLAAVHPVLTGSAVIKLYRSGVEAILATDTLERAVSTVSVAPLLSKVAGL